MTTDAKKPSTEDGQQQQPGDGLNEAINAAIDEASEDGSGKALGREEVKEIVTDLLKPTIDQVQGRAQSYYNGKLKEETDAVHKLAQARIDGLLNDLGAVLDPEQKEAFDRLQAVRIAEERNRRIEDAVNYVDELKANGGTPSQPEVELAMSRDEISLIREDITDLSDGLNVDPQDASLWTGWKPDMSYAASLALVKKNIRALRAEKTASDPASGDGRKPAPQARQQADPNSQVPPSATDAPSMSGFDPNTVTLGDAADMFRRGDIDASEWRKLGINRGWWT